MQKRNFLAASLLSATIAAGFSGVAFAANPVLKIGFVGVTSGPAASWGISNQRSMETRADWINETGGVKIGGTTYNVQIVAFDDQKDPKRAIAGMEKMAQEGIHYVVGPNVDDGAAAVRPVAESRGIMYFPYAFPKELYTKPASNAILGMVANYQSGPAIYKHLMKEKGIKKVAFVAANESDPLSQRDSGAAAAKALRVVGGGRQVIPAFVGQGKVDTRQDDVPVRHQRHPAQHARHGFGGCGYANRYYRAFNHIFRKSPFQRCKQMVPTFSWPHEFARGQRRMIFRQNQQKLTISALPMARQVCIDRDALYLGKIDKINLKLVNQVRQFAR